ncbi:hypothetical protein GCM10007989_04920 [Devosia pacifica]|uniref:Phage tail protein I n=1 Tax=Devosia pacifica TaxID=1335967 RepID=A0A918RW61_9HYPH|nr:phage tail protein I [Devosia pacifica]GHA13340.1 hypothetical protein GCM10007989_04920 [Devosia pacifica]
MSFQTILPTNSTAFERSLEQTSGERWDDLDVDLVRRFKDPWACPPHLLNFLAFERSVDIWSPDWSEERKREVIDRAPRLHRLKGTRRGLENAIALTDARLRDVIVPPAKTFLSPNTTPEQRAAFLARYAQLRIYPQRSRGQARGLFLGTRRGYVERHFPMPSDAFFRALPRAFIWDKGTETELTVLERRHETRTAEIEERIDLRQKSRARPNHYAPVGNRKVFALTSTAPRRIYSIHTRQSLEVPGDDRLARRMVHPSITPINVVADMVRERGVRRTAMLGRAYPGANRFTGFLQRSRAKERVYRRTYIFDPSRPLRRRGATTFVGVGRLGMPHHTAEITVELRYRRHPFAVRGHVAGYLMARGRPELDLTKSAIRSAKRLSDRILINTRTVAAVTAGVQRRAGALYAGQIVETV